MLKKRKFAAALLAASLILQPVGGQIFGNMPVSGVQAAEIQGNEELYPVSETQAQTAAETRTQTEAQTVAETQAQTAAPTEAQTQAPTEAQTQAPTEAQTQAPTEAQTQAPTEAQTQAPTEGQTQAPTEVQTQAPTEGQTQAPTEAQTQASTEAQTQAPTEGQTQMPTETQTEQTSEEEQSETQTEEETASERETEKETERSERKNSGKKMTAAKLEAGLGSMLPYLFAAGQVNALQALLEDQEIADGSEGGTIAASLADFSVRLANAKSSGDVEIINVYADASGKIDASQLKKKYGGSTVDVTKKYVVINVIADSAGQALSFSGYDMSLSGQPVSYIEETQPGDILYNFAAMKGDKFTDYKGTVTLSSGSGLQGTFLAPMAGVAVHSNLSGAVCAAHVTVAESVTDLMKIVFMKGAEPEDKETEEENSESETGEQESAETELSTESESELSSEVNTEGESEPSSELDTEKESESEPYPELSIERESEPSSEQSTESGSEAETEASTEELLEVEETEDTDGRTVLWYSAEGTKMQVELTDAGAAQGDAKGLEGSFTLSLKAADDIVDAQGSIVLEEDAAVQQYNLTADNTYRTEIGSALKYEGAYYLEFQQDSTDSIQYLQPAHIHFSVDENGVAVYGGTGWNSQTKALRIPMHPADGTAQMRMLTVTDGAGTPLQEAAFVVKDTQGKVIRDEEGNPQFRFVYAGTPLLLTGLADGTYLLSQLWAAQGYEPSADIEFTVKNGTLTKELAVVNRPYDADAGKIVVASEAFADSVRLSAEGEQKISVSLFADKEHTKRIGAVQELVFADGKTQSTEAVFMLNRLPEEAKNIWYPALTDENGECLEDTIWSAWEIRDESGNVLDGVKLDAQTAERKIMLRLGCTADQYPSGQFGYEVPVELTLEVQDRDGKEKKTDETFYVNLYRDAAHTEKINEAPIAFAMGNTASLKVSYQLRMTEGRQQIYLAEVDAEGNVITADSKFPYSITYPGYEQGMFEAAARAADGTDTAAPVFIKIRNRQNDTVVKLRAENEKGKLLTGTVFVLKDKKGRVLNYNNTVRYTIKDSELTLTNVLEPGTYYLSQISAAEGYAVAPDLEFTVKGAEVTEAVLVNHAVKKTDYALAVTKQVYSGKKQVYAYDTSNQKYAKQGAYTFYAALFEDAAHTRKVSEIQKITVKGLSGSVTFKNLEHNKVYYVAETDENGQPKKSDGNCAVRYTDGGKVEMNAKKKSSTIQNIYQNLPAGYRHTGTLTITKRLLGVDGQPEVSGDTFYVGIFRKADYSDTPNIVALNLNNQSSASATRRILLSGTKDMTYYIAEVDAKGRPVSSSNTFAYHVTVDHPSVTISGGDNANVTITNQTLSSKVTLYLSKRVYQGVIPQPSQETFYAGLFQDPQFTKLYVDPIPLAMNGKSEMTLKLSLNLGASAGAKIYIAEVDETGKVIKNEKDFGYEIKVVNSTAEFTSAKREVYTTLLNAAYGTVPSGGWDDMFSALGGAWGEGGFSDNGAPSSAAKTGDDTPVLPFVLLAAGALGVFGLAGYRRKRIRR